MGGYVLSVALRLSLNANVGKETKEERRTFWEKH
jgi:hypothetical protein